MNQNINTVLNLKKNLHNQILCLSLLLSASIVILAIKHLNLYIHIFLWPGILLMIIFYFNSKKNLLRIEKNLLTMIISDCFIHHNFSNLIPLFTHMPIKSCYIMCQLNTKDPIKFSFKKISNNCTKLEDFKEYIISCNFKYRYFEEKHKMDHLYHFFHEKWSKSRS